MKPKMWFFWLMFLGTIFMPDPVRGDQQIGSDISNGMLAKLSDDLTPFECWITTSHLIQKSSNPKAGLELSKIGGHTKNYNCYEALKYWRENVLPYTEEENEIKSDGDGIGLLARAIRFAGRKDLQKRILKIQAEKEAYSTDWWNFQHREEVVKNKKSEDWNTADDIFGAVDDSGNDEDLSQFEATEVPKIEYDSRTQQYAAIVTYVVVFLLAFVILCFAITIIMLCIRPQRLRRRHAEEIGEDVRFGHGSSSSNGRVLKVDGLDTFAQFSLLKESEHAGKSGTKKSETEKTESGASVASVDNDDTEPDPNANVKSPEEDKNNNDN